MQMSQLISICWHQNKSIICILNYEVISTKIISQGVDNVPLLQAWLIMDCKTSAAKTKRRGDKGSPCLTPLLHLKGIPGTPFKRTAEEPEHKIALIQEIHLAENPLYCSMDKMTWYSTLSKAFSKSSFRRTISFPKC